MFLVQRTHWLQPLARKKNKKIQRKCVPLKVRVDKYCPWQSQRNWDRLLDVNNSIMETWMMEKVNSLVSKLFLAVHRSSKCITFPPVSIAWSVAFIGALEQLRDSSWWIHGHASDEKSLEKFFCVYMSDSFCGQNVNVDREEGAGGSYHRSITLFARSFAMSVSARSLVRRERERERESLIWVFGHFWLFYPMV